MPAAPGQRWCQRLDCGAVPSAGGMQRSRHSQWQHLSPAGQLESLAQSGDSRRKQRMKSRGHLPGFWESPVLGWRCEDSTRAPHPPSLGKQDVGLSRGQGTGAGTAARGLETSLHHGLGLLDTSRPAWHSTSTVWHSVACHGAVWHGPMCALTSAMRSVTGPCQGEASTVPAPAGGQGLFLSILLPWGSSLQAAHSSLLLSPPLPSPPSPLWHSLLLLATLGNSGQPCLWYRRALAGACARLLLPAGAVAGLGVWAANRR